MDTIKLTFVIEPPETWLSEVLMAQLSELSYDSFVETQTGFEAYIPENKFEPETIVKVVNETPEQFKVNWKVESIESQNWNEIWEKNYFKPLVIKNLCVVRAPFHHDFPHLRYEIVIEPNMAFGTGNHETTSMMMEVLLETDMKGKTLLDMGCGTGILAIFSSMLGASEITAIDNDVWSYDAVVENAKINNIHNITAQLGDAGLLGSKTYDVILANIQRNVLLADMEKYFNVLNPHGKLLMSGFYLQDMPAIRQKAENLGLSESGYIENNNWIAYSFTK